VIPVSKCFQTRSNTERSGASVCVEANGLSVEHVRLLKLRLASDWNIINSLDARLEFGGELDYCVVRWSFK
jgi:hypothetical protein